MRSLSSARTFASAADLAACRVLLRDGSRTFYAASLVLPRTVRRAATGLYAFCRVADDAIDRGLDRGGALPDLRERLANIYAGAPASIPADRAFADAVFGYSIPRSFPDALLEGFEWDAANRRYESLSELNEYAVRVAGVVGAMMAFVMGIREPALIARACDLGVAMQLTNIARDVGEDARGGRIYLPLNWLRAAGIDPEAWLRAPAFNPALAGVVERVLAAADELYERSESGLANLPLACRPGMFAARLLYAEIGKELKRRRLDSVNERAVVSWRRKALVLGDALIAAAVCASAVPGGDALPEARSLLSSLTLADSEPAAESFAGPDIQVRSRAGRRRVADRVLWVVDLFERLERRDQSSRRLPELS